MSNIQWYNLFDELFTHEILSHIANNVTNLYTWHDLYYNKTNIQIKLPLFVILIIIGCFQVLICFQLEYKYKWQFAPWIQLHNTSLRGKNTRRKTKQRMCNTTQVRSALFWFALFSIRCLKVHSLKAAMFWLCCPQILFRQWRLDAKYSTRKFFAIALEI